MKVFSSKYNSSAGKEIKKLQKAGNYIDSRLGLGLIVTVVLVSGCADQGTKSAENTQTSSTEKPDNKIQTSSENKVRCSGDLNLQNSVEDGKLTVQVDNQGSQETNNSVKIFVRAEGVIMSKEAGKIGSGEKKEV